MYFKKGLTQLQIAKKLGVSPREVAKIFGKASIEAQKISPRDAKIGELYYSQRMSKSDIARKLGVSYNTVLRTFDRYGWKSLPRKTKANPEEAYKLYKKGLTLAAVAKKLGVSYYTIANYLNELGVEQRQRGYRTDDERQQAKKDKAARHREKIRALRDALFGANCRICGVGRDTRKIAIHKKNCEEHDDRDLWRLGFLKNVNPDKWAALCVMCHRGAHWAHDEMNVDIDRLEKKAQQGKTAQSEDTPQNDESSEVQLKQEDTKPSYSEEVRKMRKDLFGENCNFCGEIPDDKALVIHRKDGKKHDKEDLWDKERLQNLDLDDWVPLCQRHHRYVHWAMKRINMSWSDISSAIEE